MPNHGMQTGNTRTPVRSRTGDPADRSRQSIGLAQEARGVQEGSSGEQEHQQDRLHQSGLTGSQPVQGSEGVAGMHSSTPGSGNPQTQENPPHTASMQSLGGQGEQEHLAGRQGEQEHPARDQAARTQPAGRQGAQARTPGAQTEQEQSAATQTVQEQSAGPQTEQEQSVGNQAHVQGSISPSMQQARHVRPAGFQGEQEHPGATHTTRQQPVEGVADQEQLLNQAGAVESAPAGQDT